MRRTFIFLLELAALAVVGVLFTNQPSPTQPAPGKKYVKWEYKIVDVRDMLPQDFLDADLE